MEALHEIDLLDDRDELAAPDPPRAFPDFLDARGPEGARHVRRTRIEWFRWLAGEHRGSGAPRLSRGVRGVPGLVRHGVRLFDPHRGDRHPLQHGGRDSHGPFEERILRGQGRIRVPPGAWVHGPRHADRRRRQPFHRSDDLYPEAVMTIEIRYCTE